MGPSFEEIWIPVIQGCFVPSLVELCQVALEKRKKMWKVYNDNNVDELQRQWTTDKLWSEKITWAFGSDELKNETHSFYICINCFYLQMWKQQNRFIGFRLILVSVFALLCRLILLKILQVPSRNLVIWQSTHTWGPHWYFWSLQKHSALMFVVYL